MRILAIALASFMAVGCMPITKETIQKEQVPVYVIPTPPTVEKPVLETTKLTDADRQDINKVAKAMTIANEQLQEYADGLEKIVNKYRELSNTSTTVNNLNTQKLPVLNMDKLKQYLKENP